jgi:glycosyltransferase involved in cell wall biosynthesis
MDRHAVESGIKLSVVVPLFNEEDNVGPLYTAINAALAAFRFSYEVVLVDDGSRDQTFERAAALVKQDSHVRVVRFARNYGQTAAMAAGIQEARGEIIVTMDGDLQNDPSDIPRLLDLIDQGYDIVVGWRRKRQDQGLRVIASKLANRLMALVMGVAVKDTGCSLKAYRGELIRALPMYGEMHRFIPALSKLAGARLAQIEVKHHPRRFGVSKYGFSRIYKVLLDIISIRVLLSFARAPILWHSSMTLVAILIGLTSMSIAVQAEEGEALVVRATVGILCLSLALFVIAWGLVGVLFALNDRGVARFSSLAADLSSRIQGGRSGD